MRTSHIITLAAGGLFVAGIGAAFAMGAPEKGPSCRKNKAQRCSVCGGIGHKSRTCSVVQQQ